MGVAINDQISDLPNLKQKLSGILYLFEDISTAVLAFLPASFFPGMAVLFIKKGNKINYGPSIFSDLVGYSFFSCF